MLFGSTGGGIASTPVDGALEDVEVTDIMDDVWSSDPADWLHNPHAGEILKLEFLDAGDISIEKLAEAINVKPNKVRAVVEGSTKLDAEMDLRLARYFGMSEGFFLGLQIDYELLEARRAYSAELDRIVRRAA